MDRLIRTLVQLTRCSRRNVDVENPRKSYSVFYWGARLE
jgi:hypothetical protein